MYVSFKGNVDINIELKNDNDFSFLKTNKIRL